MTRGPRVHTYVDIYWLKPTTPRRARPFDVFIIIKFGTCCFVWPELLWFIVWKHWWVNKAVGLGRRMFDFPYQGATHEDKTQDSRYVTMCRAGWVWWYPKCCSFLGPNFISRPPGPLLWWNTAYAYTFRWWEIYCKNLIRRSFCKRKINSLSWLLLLYCCIIS